MCPGSHALNSGLDFTSRNLYSRIYVLVRCTSQSIKRNNKCHKTDVINSAWEDSDNVVTKYYQLGGLKQQTFISSQCWKLEIKNPGAGRCVLPPRHLREDQSFFVSSAFVVSGSPWLDGNLIPFSASMFRGPPVCHSHPSTHACIYILAIMSVIVFLPLFLNKDTTYVGMESSLIQYHFFIN